MSASEHTRRNFLGKVAVGIGGTGVALSFRELRSSTRDMPIRTMGRSGEKVSLIGLGGYHLGSAADERTAIRLVHEAIDNGVSFMDNCWDYHDGKAETWMGKALRNGYRKRVFLMTKIDGQTKEAANKQIEDCLRRLQTDVIDLLQFHEVIRPGDPDRIFGPSGAFKAAMAAKQAGKIRYIGFTGHKDPDVHVKMIETGLKNGFAFDASQMPLNLLDHHFESFEKRVLPLLLRHRVGVLAMKPLADGHIFKTSAVTAAEAYHYVMNLPVSVVITGFETRERLIQALDAARTFKALGQKQVATLLAKTAAHPGGRSPTRGMLIPLRST